ncbi:MAG: PAS domain S-box protein, partial [Cyanobacteria bacterium P01_A01_bin.37]
MTETRQDGLVSVDKPIGIITERDIVQFRALGLSLAQTTAHMVMSTPLFLVHPQDSLWMAHQHMQKRHTRRLVVAHEDEGLAGIVTQTSMLQPLDPAEMLVEIEQLHQLSETQASDLQQANQDLQHLNQSLQIEIAERQRLEAMLYDDNQVLEERVGLQADQLRQTGKSLLEETRDRQYAQTQLEQFFAVTPSLLCIAGLDGYFKKVNSEFSRVLGYDGAQLLSIPFIDLIHPDDRPATEAELQRLATGDITIAFENRYRRQDGSYCWLSWNATAVPEDQQIYACARDVTRQKHLEDELRQERSFISTVLETVSALVIVLDPVGNIVSFNQACERVSGYSAQEVKGKMIWNTLIPPEEQADVQSIFRKLSQQKHHNHYENYWTCKDGARKLISWSNTLLMDASGTVEYVIGTGIDITSQRQTEQHVIRQYKQGQLLGEITRKIRQSLDINEILQTAVDEVQAHLACDSVLVIQYDSARHENGRVIRESTNNGNTLPSLLTRTVSGLKKVPTTSKTTPQICACDNVAAGPCNLYSAEFLTQCNIQACIEVPIYVREQLWGLITASQCDRPRQWESFDFDLMQQLADQMGVAISQAQLLNDLESQVQHRSKQVIHTNQKLRQEIQERIKTEEALRESEQKLAGILENADDAIISIDSQQQIVMYNKGAEQIFGYTVDEVMGRSLDILLPNAFRHIHRQHVHNFATMSEESRPMAQRSRDVFGQRKTGEEFPAEASISKIETKAGPLFTVILKDITERRFADATLRRSEEQLRLTTDAMPALICYVDRDERYQFNNKTYEEWLNLSPKELEGRYVRNVLDNTYYEQIKPHIDMALAGQQVCFEADLATSEGKSRCVLATYIPNIDGHGTVQGFFGLISDISDRKATERMKDEFVSVVGHELRTPLTSIHGSLKLLATKRLGTLSAKGHEIIDIALKNTDRLTRLINDVLDLERIESGRVTMEMRQCDVEELILQAVQAMQSMADSHDIKLVTEAPTVTIMVDPDHITQALTNLISNAIKFSPAGSTIRLCAIERQTDVVLSVCDQGRGIPADKIETIFERFQQVDSSDSRQRGGTGLGLAICKNIVQQHSGKIWVESTFGLGSTFFLTLPKS